MERAWSAASSFKPITRSKLKWCPLIKFQICSIEYTPTQCYAVGALLHISNNITYKPRKDLNIYKSHEMKSTFIETVNPKKSNIIFVVVYRHPTMDFNEFINKYVNNFLIYQRRKRLLNFRSFDIDSLKYDIHSPTNEFLGYLSSSMILLYIPHPTTVPDHSKSLIDKIDNILKRSYLWKFNIYISDHFSQFLIMPSIFSDTSSHKSNVYEKH